MADRTLVVRIIGDDRSLNAAFNRSEKRTKQFETRTVALGSSVTRVFGAAGIALGGSAVFAFAKRATDEATRLNTEIAKSRQVFGDSSKEIEEWSKTTAKSIGISQRAALVAVGTFGNLLRVLDFGPQKASEMSRTLVQIAADLAAINSADPSDVLAALRSGLAGRGGALKNFGIFLTTARIQQEALAESGKKNAKALTDGEKALARYNIILRDSIPSQGGFSKRMLDGAQQSSILKANVEDLEAALGQVLIPTLTDVTTSLNQAFVVAGKLQTELGKLQAIGGIDIPINLPVSIIFKQGRGKDLRGGLAALKDNIGEALQGAFSAGTGPFKDLLERARGGGGRGFTFFPGVSERDRDRGNTSKELEKLTKEQLKDIDNAKALRESRKRFAELIKGLGLKLDKAELTESFDNDIAVLEEVKRAIIRQIGQEGKTFALVQKLVDVRQAIADKVASKAEEAAQRARDSEQRAEDAKQKSLDAFNSVIDSLTLGLEVAQATKSLADDQAALRKIESAILQRIKSEGRTTELLRQLFDVRQQEAEIAKQIAENARERQRTRQFASLGLTEEGDKPTPGTGSLLKRAQSLQQQVKGTTLDTPKTNQQLAKIVKTLKANFKTAGKEVRAAILDMLNTISGALDEKKGPLTKTTSLNSKKVLEGLGLSPEEIRALRGRLSNFNSAGVGFAGANNTRSTGSFSAPIVVENHLTLNLDGQKLASSVTRNQQKTKRRNPRQKRGPNTHR